MRCGAGRVFLVECIQHGLQDFEAEQSALLAARCQPDFQQIQHVLRLELSQFVQRFAFDGFA